MSHVDKFGHVTFGVPKGAMKESYYDLILKQFYHLGMLISNPEGMNTDANIPRMVSFIISHIPNQKTRSELRDKIKTEIDESTNNGMSDDEKKNIIININIEHIGTVADYIEKFIGIESENRLGFTLPEHEKRVKLDET